jgi:DNA polymerase III subunit epsilon
MNNNPNFIFIDLETTGLNPNLDRICQIGIIKADGSEFNTLVNPEISINPSSTEIHGITNEMVKDSPRFRDLAEELTHILKDADVFVAYNFQFDFQFLQNELFRNNGYYLKEEDFTFVDPYRIFKKLFPHSLSNAYWFYTGKELKSAHSAIVDIRATKEIFEKQQEKYPEFFDKSLKEIEEETLGDVSIIGKWFGKDGDRFIFKQGKYRGDVVKLSHKEYLEWIYKLDDASLSEKRFISEFIKN